MIREKIIQNAMELKTTMHKLGTMKMLKHNHLEMKPAEQHLMFVLSNVYNREPVKPSEVAKKLGVTLSAISHHINALEKNGYIERLQDPNDKRVSFISLSDKGKEVDDDIKEKMFKNTCDLVEHLGEEDSSELIRLMSRVLDYLDSKES